MTWLISSPTIDIPTGRALLNAMDGITYLVNAEGMVLAAGQSAWNDFAENNGGATVQGAPAIGQNLLDGISGDEIKATYQHIHATVLTARRQHVAFEYRCDAPDLKRSMRMSISRVALPDCEPALLYQSQILSTVDRPWMSLFEPDRIISYVSQEKDLQIIRLCGFCQRVAWPADKQEMEATWVEADIYYQRGGSADVRTSHGICPDCASVVQAQLVREA